MALKLYLHDATQTISGTPPSTALNGTFGSAVNATGCSTNRVMDATIGASQASSPDTSASTFTTIWCRRFVTDALTAQTIPAGNWTLAAAASAASGSLRAVDFAVNLYRPSTGSTITEIVPFTAGTNISVPTSETAITATVAGITATVLNGDVIVLELGGTEFGGTTAHCQTYYDGTTEGSASSNAAYLLTQLAGPAPPIPTTNVYQAMRVVG